MTLHTNADVMPVVFGISVKIELRSCCLLEHFSVLCSGCRSVGLEEALISYLRSTVGVRTKTFVIHRTFCPNHIQHIVANSGSVSLKNSAIGDSALCEVMTSWKK